MTTQESTSTVPADGPGEPSVEPSVALERVQNQTLPERSLPLIESYEAIVDDRDRFLWKWAHHLFPQFTLSCVAPEHDERIQTAKLEALLFVSILDDVAEKHNDRATFDEAAKIPFDHQTVDPTRDGVDREVISLALEVWDQFAPTLQDGPRADEFAEIIRFDLDQVVNAMAYSNIANNHLEFVTGSELQAYDAHNMMLFGFADIDLVHSPTFDLAELSALRQVVERAQRMVRIGNWVTTWERELSEGDFTSGIVAYALEHDIVSTAELYAVREDPDGQRVETIADAIRDHAVEAVFLRQWREELDAARQFEGQFDSVDIGQYLDGIETVMAYHLASRGLK